MFRNTKLVTLLHFKSFSFSSAYNARQLCSKPMLVDEESYVTRRSNLSVYLERRMKEMKQQQEEFMQRTKKSSIYRVPTRLRKIDNEAYKPHCVSIGPYHHGSPRLQASQKLKWHSLNSLVGFDKGNDGRLDKLVAALKAIEVEVRECYSEEVGLSKDDEFVKMMLLDGCFIIELLKDLNKNEFKCSSFLTKRWMLPVIRHDLIALENQIPIIVLQIIFNETRTKSKEEISLEELALHFFDPLMPREDGMLQQSIKLVTNSPKKYQHLLDLFHSSITLPKNEKRAKEPHMYRSVTELKEAGIKVRVLENTQPLNLMYEKGVLKMPSLQIDNHTGNLLRNLVAYEQCHQECEPDITTYLFFIDKLINSTEDVGLLHYEGVIQHTLGSNQQVAELVNKLCIQVEHDCEKSYLSDLVESLNRDCDSPYIKATARLKHDYFPNFWVSLSTVAALILIYLTLVQTSCSVIAASEEEGLLQEKKGLWFRLHLMLVDPLDSALRFLAKGFESEDLLHLLRRKDTVEFFVYLFTFESI